jgi:hypothetical protein
LVKRNTNGRKSNGRNSEGSGGIAVIEDPIERDDADEIDSAPEAAVVATPKKERKAKAEVVADGNFGVGDVRKAAAFANSIGGLDKAIALLQILKVAKEVQ